MCQLRKAPWLACGHEHLRLPDTPRLEHFHRKMASWDVQCKLRKSSRLLWLMHLMRHSNAWTGMRLRPVKDPRAREGGGHCSFHRTLCHHRPLGKQHEYTTTRCVPMARRFQLTFMSPFSNILPNRCPKSARKGVAAMLRATTRNSCRTISAGKMPCTIASALVPDTPQG